MALQDTLVITVHQYSSQPILSQDMEKLTAIAQDYRTVKQYVYNRYSGIGSLAKLYPGYTIQNEMTKSDLRGRLGLPSVYFYLAIFDAIKDIRAEWARVHGKILERIQKNEQFSGEEKHYLRYVLKMTTAYAAALNHDPFDVPQEFFQLDGHRLNNYLCRQTRKYLKQPKSEKSDGFRIGAKAYRYEDGGIYIATKEPRKRVFIPLTDNSRFSSQLYVRLFPEENRLMIAAPVEIKKKLHTDYQAEIGLAYGYHVMFTSSTGSQYGDQLGTYERKEAERVRSAMSSRGIVMSRAERKILSEEKTENIRVNNLGRQKYLAKRQRYLNFIKSYINREINRFIDEEKPAQVYIPRLPSNIKKTHKKALNHSMTIWRKGYIRKRLFLKCEANSIRVIEVMGKDISLVCSQCGDLGEKKGQQFHCLNCGLALDEKVNSARNALLRGRLNSSIHESTDK